MSGHGTELSPRQFPPAGGAREQALWHLPSVLGVATVVGVFAVGATPALSVGLPLLLWSTLLKSGLFSFAPEHKTRALESVPEAMQAKLSSLEVAGFEVGELFVYEGVQNVACAIAVHSVEPILAMVVHHATGAGIDLVTMLGPERDAASLTTSSLAMGGTVPRPPQALGQLLPDADVHALYAAHRETLIALERYGLLPSRVERGEFKSVLFSALDKQRAHMWARPLWRGSVAVLRALTKRSPYLRPLLEQRAARAWLEARRRSG